jgi:hypothetical protein
VYAYLEFEDHPKATVFARAYLTQIRVRNSRLSKNRDLENKAILLALEWSMKMGKHILCKCATKPDCYY